MVPVFDRLDLCATPAGGNSNNCPEFTVRRCCKLDLPSVPSLLMDTFKITSLSIPELLPALQQREVIFCLYC